MSEHSFLMCSPEYFNVSYQINPWMNGARQPDAKLAMKEWQALYDLLKTLGAKVQLIEPVRNLPDMVFTANAGLVGTGFLIRSNFRHAERAKEEIVFDRWFRANGYTVKIIERPHIFEGEGDALFMGEELYTGYHFRSDVQAHDDVSAIMHQDYFALELKDQRFYHLDTCFAPLDQNTALVFMEAFEPYAQLVLLENIQDVIQVSKEEALKFACNLVVVEKDVVLPLGCPKAKAELEERGFKVHELDFSEFLKSGGAAKCLVLNLDPKGRVIDKRKLRS